MESLVPAILEQKVTGIEARRAWRAIATRYGEPAPGPAGEAGMRVPPAPATLARLPYYALHPLGVERRRAEVIRRVALQAEALEDAGAAGRPRSPRASSRFRASARGRPPRLAVRALGDPDAVSVGDFHLPNLVAWALAGEARASDERMLELLEPYRGQRARAVRLLETSGIRAPRYGPRFAPRSIAAI